MNRIKTERENLGYKQTELAKKLNIANNTLNNYEKGNRAPDIEMLSTLADLFGCSVDYLIGRTDNRNSTIIEKYIDDKNIKVEINKDFFKTLTIGDIDNFFVELKNAGFDMKKLVEKHS